jgi:hypothetical protein
MLIVGYRADPEVLRGMLPPGLEPNESGFVQMNMYCPSQPLPRSALWAPYASRTLWIVR